ncbi:hypothetical protein CERZMDRAFT_44216 [Cercospora zeae-maydis SCOH1-5]|uniref:Pentacotripeptide-repeat region of PRORP domain-containing protein n=1 Tax=Cercospora zeae-maydis SCOH1-5 TaxID=717836 RepID=A0A6A6FC03_9PEZI|nr:hypothetical protein CERZMDRAFT_44216 [Cercospora zeae-maydis SCOH1-5]
MLECSACVSRVLRSIAGDGRYGRYAAANPTWPLLLTPHLAQRPQRRGLATAVRAEAPSDDALSGLVPVEKPRVEHFTQKRGGPIVIANEKALRKELEYLKDPLKLADHVEYVLRCEQPEKALSLCRLASKRLNCTVSWNHVVAWHAHNGRPAKAVAIFNEMKKRGQFPDSYTYMRLLTGLSESKNEVAKIVSIFHGMCSPSSRVKPNTSHTNAALRACSLAGDMDAMWGIVSRMPERGANAPDAKIYTTILQAIKHNAFGDGPDASLMTAFRQEAVNEGRRIWQEVISKWREGALVLDEDLVVAMAGLLLMSNRMQDRDNVFDLIHQTTGLERQIAPLSSKERRTEHVPVEKGLDEDGQTAPLDDYDDFTPSPSSNAFKPVTPAVRSDKSKRPQPLVRVRAGNGILAMLIRACDVLRTPKAMNSYWDILTSAPHNVKPDPANLQLLFRALRANRSSSRSSHVLQRLHNQIGIEPHPLTYVMAMDICVRDRNNPNVVDIATGIVDDMEKNLFPLNMETLKLYVKLAQATDNGPNIIKAVNRVLAMEGKVFKSDQTNEPGSSPQDRAVAHEVYSGLRRAIDKLLLRGLVPKDAEQHWREVIKKVDSSLSSLKFRSQVNLRRGPRAHAYASKGGLGANDARVEKVKAKREDGHVLLPPDAMEKGGRPMHRPPKGWSERILTPGVCVQKELPRMEADKSVRKQRKGDTDLKRGHGFADSPADLAG